MEVNPADQQNILNTSDGKKDYEKYVYRIILNFHNNFPSYYLTFLHFSEKIGFLTPHPHCSAILIPIWWLFFSLWFALNRNK